MANGIAHFFARRLDQARTMLLLSLQEHPDWVPTNRFLAACYAHLGQLDEAKIIIKRLRALTLSLYARAAEYATSRGLILADTKLEFGRQDGRIVWIDEAFTPDSSRYWDAGQYAPGRGQPSFDKQFVRDWLESTGWNKRPPAPKLPEGVVRTTRDKYLDAYRRLTDGLPEHLEG